MRAEAGQRALITLAEAAAGGLTADQVLDLVAETAASLVDGSTVHVWLASDEGCELRLAAESGRYPGAAGVSLHPVLRVAEGLAGATAKSAEPLVLASLRAEWRLGNRASARDQGFVSYAGVRFGRGDRVLGVLCLFTPRRHRFTPQEVGILHSLGAHAAVALENVRLFSLASTRADRLKAAGEIGQLLAATRDADHILDLIGEKSREILGAEAFGLFRFDVGGRLAYARGFGFGAEFMRAHVLAPGEGVAGQAAAERRAILTRDILDDPAICLSPEARARIETVGTRAVVGVPILIGAETLGVLAVYHPAGFSIPADEVEFLETLASHAAVALENARFFEELTQAYQELKTAQEQLVQTEKLRALGEMASGVAHDFNNLLAVILGRTQLVQQKVEDPTVRQWLDIVEQAALDGAQTVRQIQEFTRVRRDRPTESVDLNQVVGDAVEMTRPRWHGAPQARGLDVSLRVQLEPIPPVEGRPAELREVLTNLILNAVDALPRGGAITLATRHTEDGVEVSVADDGVGMPETVRRRIFEPFFSTKGPKGTGLGLAMAYAIVSRHGGEISVESAEGAGSTFRIRLPVRRDSPREGAAVPALAARSTVRVLVIDDEKDVSESLADMLRVDRHEVVVAGDGAHGLECFRSGAFDLVMTDLAMPDLSGWQVAQAVKTLRPEVPVVLVTGWGVEVSVEQLRRNGVDGLITKPFRLEDVQTLLAGLRDEGRAVVADR